MRISLEWLNELVNLDGLTPEVIADALTNSGLEVEAIETHGAVFSNVVVAKVLTVEPHPNADRLRLVTVDLGSTRNQVVCGAPNVEEGSRIAYAQLGAQVINRKEGGMFELKPAKIRGVESTGMICSLEELGLETKYTQAHDGIWHVTSLTSDSDLGKDLKDVLKLQSVVVLDVSPTANRGDQMSMIGVAREVSALFGRPIKLPDVPRLQPQVDQSPIQAVLPDTSVCQYYAGAWLKSVRIAPSPDWLVQRLEHAGIRPINNVVDITNYVLLEYGQPLHAFDATKCGNAKQVSARQAKPGETLVTLDEIERTLTEQSVVITLDDRPVALAGVMGGFDTEIGDQTTEVFLEAAYFPSASNRRSARSVGLRSESSARFERGVDAARCTDALMRAIQLLKELAGAEFVSLTEADHRTIQPQQVSLSLKRLERVVGMPVSSGEVERILTSLGFGVQLQDVDRLMVDVPTFRHDDVSREIDLIEEVVRIYGYDKIPYTLPEKTDVPEITLRAGMLQTMCRALMGLGLTEVSTFSLVGDELLRKCHYTQAETTSVRVNNSHSDDHVILRQSLIPTLIDVAHHNQAQGNHALWCFELGHVYFKQCPAREKDSGVAEPLHLGGMLMGSPRIGAWHQQMSLDYFALKGIIETLLGQLNLQGSLRWIGEAKNSFMHPGQTATLKLGKVELGFLGQVHPLLYDELKLRGPVFVFELDVEAIYQQLLKQPAVMTAQPLSAYPAVTRDMAFSAPLTVSHQQIVSALTKLQDPLLHDIELFDEYRGEQVGKDQRSLAYRVTLQSSDRTLTEQDISSAMEKLKQQLQTELAVQFR